MQGDPAGVRFNLETVCSDRLPHRPLPCLFPPPGAGGGWRWGGRADRLSGLGTGITPGTDAPLLQGAGGGACRPQGAGCVQVVYKVGHNEGLSGTPQAPARKYLGTPVNKHLLGDASPCPTAGWRGTQVAAVLTHSPGSRAPEHWILDPVSATSQPQHWAPLDPRCPLRVSAGTGHCPPPCLG